MKAERQRAGWGTRWDRFVYGPTKRERAERILRRSSHAASVIGMLLVMLGGAMFIGSCALQLERSERVGASWDPWERVGASWDPMILVWLLVTLIGAIALGLGSIILVLRKIEARLFLNSNKSQTPPPNQSISV